MTLKGKGFFTFIIPNCEGGNPAAILAAAQAAGLSHVLVKIADGAKPFGIEPGGEDYTLPVVQALRGAGIAVWGWHYVYGNDPSGEAKIAIQRVQDLSLDGYVVDAEDEYKQPGKDKVARRFMTEVRAVLGELPIALSSYRFPNYHPELPWSAFLEQSDYNMPQVYWEQAHNAASQLRESFRQCNALPHAKPYLATGPTYAVGGWAPTAQEIQAFLQTAKELGIEAANFFSWDYCRRYLPHLWNAVSDFDWPAPPQVTPGLVVPGQPSQPEQPPVTPPEQPAAAADAFTQQYLAALNSRQASRMVALYAGHAVHVRRDKIVRFPNLQSAYDNFFGSLPAGTVFTLTRSQADRDIRYLDWKAGDRTGRETLLLDANQIVVHYAF